MATSSRTVALLLTGMEDRDRQFAIRLAEAVSNHRPEIDAEISRLVPIPPADGVRNILRLGIAQLRFADIPPHAAVHTSVSLADSSGFPNHKGLVNAVLRKVAATLPPITEQTLSEQVA